MLFGLKDVYVDTTFFKYYMHCQSISEVILYTESEAGELDQLLPYLFGYKTRVFAPRKKKNI